MNSSANFIRANDLKFTRDYMIVSLEDGRILHMPLDWFPPLRSATRAQLHHYEWIGKGIGIEWPELDEFLSVEGFLRQSRSMASNSMKPLRQTRKKSGLNPTSLKSHPAHRNSTRKKVSA